MRKIGILLLLLSGWIQSVSSQEVNGVRVIARPAEKDSIYLRWAPTDKETWKYGNLYGYVVERYTILRDGMPLEDSDRRTLSEKPLKPQPIDVWLQHEDDKYVSIAAECIFSESAVPLLNIAAITRRHKEEQNKFSFALFAADQSLLAARLSGLYMVDQTAKSNEKYLYSIHIPTPDSIHLDTAFVFTGLSEYLPLPQPLLLTARWADRQVNLSWNILYLNHIYNSYIVEKSPDGTNYTPISESASVQLADENINPEWAYKSDSLPDNHTTWYYRIRGVNAFGETGPPSDSIVGRGRLLLSESPVVTSKEVVDNRSVRISWMFDEKYNDYINGFRLYRSEKPEGAKEKIYEGNDPLQRSYFDLSPSATNYYILSVYDGESEQFATGLTYAELIDSIPPAAPRGLAGLIDLLGVAHLTWESNSEKDLSGYRIYSSSRPDFEFIPITSTEISGTSYEDTVNIQTLTQEIYYRLRAIDQRGNQSEFSEILELKRPDVIPPVSPVIKDIIAEKDGISITWYNSSSSDVARHHILRKAENDNAFLIVTTVDMLKIPEKTTTYKDKSIRRGEIYLYQIEAEDESGLYSVPSSPVYCKAIGEKSAQQDILKAKVDKEEITLTWTSPESKKIEKVLIYRAIGEDHLRLYSNSIEASFTDRKVVLDKNIRYRIKIVYEDETTTGFSNEVTLKL